ncbi:uncharacterized protein N0V89_011351 [Didymosphaeria variabile]|uniref:Enoyl reductase (ER) domain-containing protein n=1 Tax=Didymosphaeria variabile TaxID=1932322 RepID=A0A9W8XBI8_9PLEO|nr:uncharacterized protein N0V89_011351 [Didymosphaeria variabile]KAJ4345222.1 hypothetical protein N0V89_011351 [Didymosphaeria variabile]
MPRALILQPIESGKPGKVYYPLQIKEVSKPIPGPHQLLVRLSAAALNHRDLFIRRHLYPGISLTNPLLADGYGTVVAIGPDVSSSSILNKPVLLTPMRGWEVEPSGPENSRQFTVLGGTKATDIGTAQDFVIVQEDEVELAPEHLTPAEGAALPLAGLTGWRALVTKSNAASPGKNILITGIGGGVALQVLQFAVAFGCNVYVTSGDASKLAKAKAMGAKGGVSYKSETWEKDLRSMLPDDRRYLDAIIDGAGGKVVSKTVPILKHGGVISQYGMTISPQMDWVMPAVLANIELKGTAMGSRQEFKEMVAFVNEHKIRPIVSRTVKGLSNLKEIDGLFAEMQEGKQFGKLVIEIDSESQVQSRL